LYPFAKFALALWFFPSALLACPVCNSDTGIAVREGIKTDFAFHFLAAMSPFAVILTIILVATGGPRSTLGDSYVRKSR